MGEQEVPTGRGKRRLGVMGGTFDPIHHGHLVAASEVAAQFHLDEVVFVPTGQPWQKSHKQVSPAEDRYLMTVIATASNPQFSVSRSDIDRNGPTYTIDTLRDLREVHGDADLFFITGADALSQILTWRDAEELFSLSHFIGVTRPGHVLTDDGLPEGASPSWRFPRWRSPPRTAARGSPRGIRSGTWCRTVWSATSTSASCTAANEPRRGAPVNDRQNPYDPYYQQPQIVGYDEYGQPVYQQPGQQQYDPYGQQQQQQPQQHPGQQQPPQQAPQAGQGYGYDPYAQQQPAAPPPQQYDPYATQQHQPQQPSPQQGYGYDGYGYDTGQQPAAVDTTQQWIPQQAPAPAPVAAPPEPEPETGAAAVPGQRRGERDYRTEQFSFIEEPDEDSEDVIDWLKFTESRSERREEARRRGRNRMVALIVVVALVVVGGVGYLWSAGKIPGLSAGEKENTATTGPQRRDVIVVHLHNTKGGGTSTALLVDNVTTKQGTTVLLPNSLAVSDEDGVTSTLGKSVDDDGTSGTRDSIDTLLGTDIGGTWRLDTPYLENLVDLVGNIDIDTDTDVPDTKKGVAPLVKKGEAQTLSGPMAVAYATYRGPGEAEAKQLMRFGQVMRGVLRKVSDDPKAATVTVQTLAQILDPSLPEADLGAFLAKLAEHAKIGDYKTALLPVQDDGTLTEAATESVVKDILGGTVKAPDADAAVRVGIKNATGDDRGTESARIQLVNGGYSFVNSGKSAAVASSQVLYREAADKEKATQVAKTLGLPVNAVKKGKPAGNADVSVVIGQDYKID